MNFKIYGLYFILCGGVFSTAFGQQTPGELTLKFYQSLNKGDSVVVSNLLHDDLELEHYNQDTTVKFTKEDFLKILPKFKKKIYQEEFEIIAEVPNELGYSYTTVAFEFILKGKKDHCGIDHFLWGYDEAGGYKIRKVFSSPSTCEDRVEHKAVKNETEYLDSLIINWHDAAAQADFERYFGLMGKDFYFLGTDPTERWSKKEFKAFCEPHFEKAPAWSFKTIERNWYFSSDKKVAWFDERLDTWMLDCRGSGVLEKNSTGKWKLKHYNLTVLIENEKVKEFIQLREN